MRSIANTLGLLMGLLLNAIPAYSIDGIFNVTESWSVTLEYSDWADTGFTGTRYFSGTQSGAIIVKNGEYALIDKIGLPWTDPGSSFTNRSIYLSGGSYYISSRNYAFAPAFGSKAYGLVFLGAFAVKVPLIDGEVPAFNSYDYYSASGADLSSISGEGNMLGSDLKAYVSSTVTFTPKPPEAVRPTLSITRPTPNQRIGSSPVTINGKAGDNVGVAQIFYQINDGTWTLASGTTEWSASVGLTPGANVARAYAVDINGNTSPTSSVTFQYVLTSPVVVHVGGNGAVNPNLNGQSLEIGKSYTITATPGAGFLFSNWTGSIAATTPKLTFTMQSNLMLQANFVPNPFIPAKGTYDGLFAETNGVTHDTAGYFNAAITDKGAFSGKLLIGGQTPALSGQFDVAGYAMRTVARKGLPPLTVELQLVGNDELHGRVSDGNWSAELLADRATFNALNPAPQVGNYTMVVPGNMSATTQPAGDGFGMVTVTAAGAVQFAGTLAEGSKVTQASGVSKHGMWPFYAPLYGGKGSIIGWVNFLAAPSIELGGTLIWTKPALAAGKFYPAGFTNAVPVTGSVYVPPPSGRRVLNFSEAVVITSGGNLSGPVTNQVILGTDNKVTNLSSNKLTMTFAPATGSFKGSVVNPASGTTISFQGALQQKQNFGAGFALGTNQSARVYFGPP